MLPFLDDILVQDQEEVGEKKREPVQKETATPGLVSHNTSGKAPDHHHMFARKDTSMQFIVIAYDGTDEEALQRRLAVREVHIALGDSLVASGQQLYGVALLNDAGKMIGSVLICDFPSREEFNVWLAKEPYVTGHVWERIEVLPCRVGPSFQKKEAREM